MRRYRLPRQRGAIFIMFAVMVLALLGMAGLALDLAQVYNRKAELQGLADAAALAAARELNGTGKGVDAAVAAAAAVAASYRYQYQLEIPWSSAALRFAAAPATPDAAWSDAASAQSAPQGLLYAKVDTSQLGEISNVPTLFMRFSPGAPAMVDAAARAVAGRLTTPVTPLAICALSNTPAASRPNNADPAYNELVEFGFRRGVGYNLMELNPNGVTAEHFLIDPLSPPGMPGAVGNFTPAVVGPFVCAGKMLMPTVTGGTLNLQRNFPLAALYQQLNSRFDNYTGNLCTAQSAPPDSNIRAYAVGSIPWMTTAPAVQTAARWLTGSKLWTRADPQPGDSSNTAPQYGPLWSFAKAVPYSAYSAGTEEPAGGYTPFSTSAWAKLYTPGPPAAAASYPTIYPNATPYSLLSGATFLAPNTARRPGLGKRRVLNLALLECPVAAGTYVSARVAGIGRFFMTVQATSTVISAEFAGAAPPSSLYGDVELLP